MNKLLIIGGVILFIVGVVASSSLFIVEQTQQAIVLFFGKPQKTIRDPGLYFKIPFGEEVVYYDKRVLDLDPPKERMILLRTFERSTLTFLKTHAAIPSL